MTMSLIASGTRSWRRCDRGGELCRVLTARFMHETNTFSPVKTDMSCAPREMSISGTTPQKLNDLSSIKI